MAAPSDDRWWSCWQRTSRQARRALARCVGVCVGGLEDVKAGWETGCRCHARGWRLPVGHWEGVDGGQNINLDLPLPRSQVELTITAAKGPPSLRLFAIPSPLSCVVGGGGGSTKCTLFPDTRYKGLNIRTTTEK